MALRYDAGMSFEERAALLTDRLLDLDQVKEWKHAVKVELARPECPVTSNAALESPVVVCLLDKMGLLGLLKRTVIDLHCEAMQTVAAEAKHKTNSAAESCRFLPETTTDGCNLDVVRAARDNWEKITSDEMLRLAKEMNRPLVALNTNVETVEITARTDGLLTGPEMEMKPSKRNKILATRFLYDGSDLLNSLQAIEPVNRARDTAGATEAWGSIKLQLYSPPFPELRRLFSELSPDCGQIGVDDLFPTQRSIFLAEKNRVGDVVLTHQSVSMARQYSKTGCPVSLRPQIWRQVLVISLTAQDRNYFEHLKKQAAQWVFLTDDLYLLDLQQTIDSSDYFIFQDHLESVLMAFTRDTYVKDHALQVNGSVFCSSPVVQAVPKTTATSESKFEEPMADTTTCRVPPNGVLPFSGLVMYMAPLAYVYADPVEIYFVFRELYVRYWSKLNAIRTERSTMLPLCKLFEELVVRSSPAAVFHLINIGIKPLDIAFPWIQSAFSGVLDIDQVLLLWDRIIGYDSLEIVAIFAAALFHLRANELELITKRDEADELFAELIDIQVVTLLQDYLFSLQ